MTIENSGEESLVGLRSHERGERMVEDVAADGVAIWEAFLSDRDALVTSKEDIQDAKNAFEEAKVKHPEVIEMCQREPIEKCIEAVSSIEKAA